MNAELTMNVKFTCVNRCDLNFNSIPECFGSTKGFEHIATQIGIQTEKKTRNDENGFAPIEPHMTLVLFKTLSTDNTQETMKTACTRSTHFPVVILS